MYVIVGANGYLGSNLMKTVLETTRETVLATCRDLSHVWNRDPRVTWIACDIARESEVDALAARVNALPEPARVAFLAATHHPDVVQRDPEAARHVNLDMLTRFLAAAQNLACLYYPSTDSVYGESVGGQHFKESDPLAPVNVYGRQKAEAERLVTGAGYSAVRFPFLAGPSLLPHKKHFTDVIVETISAGEPIELFCDSFRSSLDFGTAAGLLARLMATHNTAYPRLLNLSGDDDLSKYDVGLLLARKIGADERLIRPLRMADDDTIFVTRRAQSTLLDNSLVKRTLGLDEIKINL